MPYKCKGIDDDGRGRALGGDIVEHSFFFLSHFSSLVEERGTLAVGVVEWEGFPTNHNSPFLPPPLSPTHHTLRSHIRWYKHK